MITLVVAAARNGVIGKDGAIPWRISDDLKRFKALTTGHPVVMGRKTWDSLPRKPLPGRTNIVVTRQAGWNVEGAVTLHSPEAALAEARLLAHETVFVIGGADIYRAFLPLADRIELTKIDADFDGDAHFTFDRAGWQEIAREARRTDDGLDYAYVTLIRG